MAFSSLPGMSGSLDNRHLAAALRIFRGFSAFRLGFVVVSRSGSEGSAGSEMAAVGKPQAPSPSRQRTSSRL